MHKRILTLRDGINTYEKRNTEAHINDNGNTANHNPDIVNGEGIQNVICLMHNEVIEVGRIAKVSMHIILTIYSQNEKYPNVPAIM